MSLNTLSNPMYLNTLLQTLSDVIIFLSPEGNITELSPKVEDWYSWQLNKVRGKPFESLYQSNMITMPFSLTEYHRLIKTEEIIFSTVKLNKEKIYLSWSAIPINPDLGTILMGKNITPTKKLNIHHRSLSSQIEQIAACVPGNFYWKNTNAQYLGCNEILLNTLGLTSMDEIIGKTDNDLWPEYAEALRENDQKVIQTGLSLFLEEQITMPNQGKRYFTVIKMPLFDEEGTVIGILGNSLDITELKNTQAELQIAIENAEAANRAKTEFIANMSHDIRTPLTGVIGLSKILEQSLQNPEEKEKAHLLHGSGEELLHMLNDILDDIRAGHLRETDLKNHSFDLHQCIADLIRLESPATMLKGLALKAEITPSVPRYIRSDRNKIHRILLNLLGNAIKFTQSGHISLSVDCVHCDKNEAHLKFSVLDTGIGIPEEAQAQVFNRFFKVTSSYKGLYEGHGLGLHIAQSYAELLGGHITLTSELAVGTTFHFDVTCGLGEPPAQLEKSPTLPSSIDCSEQTKHLLLVEDNLVALKTLKFLLKQKGYTFAFATSGEEAWTLLQKESFDALITDIGLPGISGTLLSQRLRNQEKALHKPPLPIIALTGHAKETALDECLQHGMNEVLSKPASIDSLHLCIQKLTQKQATPYTKTTDSSTLQSPLGVDLPNTEAELFQLESFSLFDEASALNQIGDKQLLITLIQAYLSLDMQQDIKLMQAHYEQGHWDEVEKLAHKIKGGVAYIGTQKMCYACQYLERYYKAGHRTLLDPLYQQILQINDQTNQILQQWLNQTL